MRRVTTTLLAGLVLAACGGDAAGPEDPDIEPEILFAALGAAGQPLADGTLACARGGTIAHQTGMSISVEDGVVSLVWQLVATYDGCTVPVASGHVITDGTLEIEGLDRYRPFEDRAPEIIESTAHQTGRLRIRHADYDRTCDIDVTRTFDPGTGTIHFTGTVCDDPVDFTFQRPDLTT